MYIIDSYLYINIIKLNYHYLFEGIMKNKKLNTNNIYLLIGNRIKETRISLNISQIDLTNMINIPLNNLIDIEEGKQKISLSLLSKISTILNVDTNYLLIGISNNIIKHNIEKLDEFIQLFKIIRNMSYNEKIAIYNILNLSESE